MSHLPSRNECTQTRAAEIAAKVAAKGGRGLQPSPDMAVISVLKKD